MTLLALGVSLFLLGYIVGGVTERRRMVAKADQLRAILSKHMEEASAPSYYPLATAVRGLWPAGWMKGRASGAKERA